MPLDFPSSPTVGQAYLNWTWNGVAWVVVPGPPLASLAQSSQNAGRNYLDNALFNIQQRGAGPFTAYGYNADRWIIAGTTDAVSITMPLLADADRAAIGDEGAVYGYQNSFTGNAAAAAWNALTQYVEDTRRLSGKTVTLSFWAIRNSGTATQLGVSYGQYFGSGGSATVSGNGTAVTISPTWARYSVTMTIPSTTGKTTGPGQATLFRIWFSSGVTNALQAGSIGVQSGVVTVWGVQVEVGSQATPLEKLVPEVDLARCQRFYHTGIFQVWGYANSGQPFGQTLTFPAAMRAAPTITFTAPAYQNASNLAVNIMGASQASVSTLATATGNNSVYSPYTASADL